MNLSETLLGVLACPKCGRGLSAANDRLVCSGPEQHQYAEESGFLTFAKPPAGKYEKSYANRYAALWAFGYETRHRGLNEPLYRTVSSLIAESLSSRSEDSPPIVADCGCGVGRSTADSARLAAAGQILGIDGSLAMLETANRVVLGTEPVTIELPQDGFDHLTIKGRGASNVFLMRADVEHLPLADSSADIALSVNIVDRLPRGPELALEECFRILRPGGHLIFTDPLNWIQDRLWRAFPDRKSIITLLTEKIGFEVDCWFDRLAYREVLDARESFEEFNTLVALARKPVGSP